MSLEPNSQIVVYQKQRYTNNTDILSGEFISQEGDQAIVMIEGEVVPRKIAMTSISAAAPLLGDLTDRPNEMPVLDQTPQRR